MTSATNKNAKHPLWQSIHGRIAIALFASFTGIAQAAISPNAGSSSSAPIVNAPIGASEGSSGHNYYLSGVEAMNTGDMIAAIQWWRISAAEGHLLAQYNLGSAYATGSGVPVDAIEASHWWRLAALQGSTDAQYNLGVIYFEGNNGIARNVAEASMWWYMAATGGDAAAQFRLGYLAATGEGGEVNLADARMWWKRSAAQGFEIASKALELLDRSESVSKAQ